MSATSEKCGLLAVMELVTGFSDEALRLLWRTCDQILDGKTNLRFRMSSEVRGPAFAATVSGCREKHIKRPSPSP